jgi:tetratricopeptide (TPR) repeat protein
MKYGLLLFGIASLLIFAGCGNGEKGEQQAQGEHQGAVEEVKEQTHAVTEEVQKTAVEAAKAAEEKVEEAVKTIEEKTGEAVETVEPYLKKAQDYKTKGDYEAAIAAAKKAVEISPNDDLRAYQFLVGLYFDLGRFGEAAELEKVFIAKYEQQASLDWMLIQRHVKILRCAYEFDAAIQFLENHSRVAPEKITELINRVKEDRINGVSSISCD